MYNKKCKSTFLFVLALICLLTLIIPFMKVGYMGEKNVALFIFYYIFIVIFGLSIVVNIAIGIYSLFSNNFSLICFQEIASYLSFLMVLLNLIIFAPSFNTSLTIGYSVLVIETFIMAFLSDIIKLIKKIPRTIRSFKENLNENRLKKQLLLPEQTNEINEEENKKDNDNFYYETNKYGDIEQVEIIPPDDELI